MAQDHHEITRHRVLPIPPVRAVDEQPAPRSESSRIQSTEHHRNAEIGGLITEAGSSGVGLLNLTAQIPFQFAQAMMAFGSAIFSSQMKTPERIVQVTQGTISAVRLALSIAMIAEDEPCMDNKNTPLCKSALIFNLLYIGVLSVAATVAASSQETSTKPQATVQNV